jgi:CBS domain-containing protein
VTARGYAGPASRSPNRMRFMSEYNASTQQSLRSFLRPAPPLSPEDSLRRCLSLTRFQPLTTLPVTENGILKGVVPQTCLLPALQMEPGPAREQLLDRPIADFLQSPPATASAEMSVDEVGRLCAAHGLSEIAVVDAQGYCFGIISAADLLLPEAPAPRPERIAGMATPFGVYLTDGSTRAGVNDFALMTTGVAMSMRYVLSYLTVQAITLLLHRVFPGVMVFDPDYMPPAHKPLLGLVYVGMSLVVLGIFLLLMRLTRLAGYHAAEHQTVHAIERGERLVPEIVRRMPRPHPRCGTNFVAAVLVFSTLSQVFEYIPAFDGGSAQIVAVVATLFTWRSVGTFLQERFTTRPASDRELASGIAAGNELLVRYLNSPPSRPGLLKRIWLMGMVQVMTGMGVTFLVVYLVTLIWKRFA